MNSISNISMKDLTLKQAVESYVYGPHVATLKPTTRSNYERSLSWMPDNEISQKPIREITTRDLENYLSLFNAYQGTKASVRALISASMRGVIIDGLRTNNPVTYTTPAIMGSGAHRWPDGKVDEAINKLTGTVLDYLAVTVALLYYTGQRLSDVVWLRPKDRKSRVVGGVKEEYFTIVQQKTGEVVHCPITPELAAILDRYSNCEYYIKYRNTNTIRVSWGRARHALGLTHMLLHGLRKTASCEAAEGGATEAELQAMLGHKSSTAALLYRKQANQQGLATSAMSKRWR